LKPLEKAILHFRHALPDKGLVHTLASDQSYAKEVAFAFHREGYGIEVTGFDKDWIQ